MRAIFLYKNGAIRTEDKSIYVPFYKEHVEIPHYSWNKSEENVPCNLFYERAFRGHRVHSELVIYEEMT